MSHISGRSNSKRLALAPNPAASAASESPRAAVWTLTFILVASGLTLVAQSHFDEGSTMPKSQQSASKLVAGLSAVEGQKPASPPKPNRAEIPEPNQGTSAASACGLNPGASCPSNNPVVSAPEPPASTEPQANESSDRINIGRPVLDSSPTVPTPARPSTPQLHAISEPIRQRLQPKWKPLSKNSREFREIQRSCSTLSAERVSECQSQEREAYEWSVNQRSTFPKQQYPERSAKRVACWDTAKAGDVLRFTRYKNCVSSSTERLSSAAGH